MKTLILEGKTAYDRGFFHGKTLAKEISEIASIRETLAVDQGKFKDVEQLRQIAELHIPLLREFDEQLYEEMRGIADGAELPLSRIIVLNHYTDLKDLDPQVLGLENKDDGVLRPGDHCSAVVASTIKGNYLGQTWDMHASAMPYVIMLGIPRMAANGVVRPSAWMLSLAGCIGMAGQNEHGVGITINNLRASDARVGVVWPALVRKALIEPSAPRAKSIIEHATLGSGHHYLVADKTAAFGIETSGQRFEVVYEAYGTFPNYVHTNHCLGKHVAEVSGVAPTSTTQERFDQLSRQLSKGILDDRKQLWKLLGQAEGGVCDNLSTPENPHAMATCAGIVMDLGQPRVEAKPGVFRDAKAEAFDFEALNRTATSRQSTIPPDHS